MPHDPDPYDRPECPQCGGPPKDGGHWGSSMWLRCQDCGWTWSERDPPPPPEEPGGDPCTECQLRFPDDCDECEHYTAEVGAAAPVQAGGCDSCDRVLPRDLLAHAPNPVCTDGLFCCFCRGVPGEAEEIGYEDDYEEVIL